MRSLIRSLWALPLAFCACVHVRSPAPEPPPFEWRYHGGDAASTRFAPVTGIDSTNFSQLRVIWRWGAPDPRIRETGDVRINPSSNECTPLMVDGTLYVSSPYNIVAALDAATGRELWTFDPEAWKVDAKFNVSRGVAYWSDRHPGPHPDRHLVGVPSFPSTPSPASRTAHSATAGGST